MQWSYYTKYLCNEARLHKIYTKILFQWYNFFNHNSSIKAGYHKLCFIYGEWDLLGRNGVPALKQAAFATSCVSVFHHTAMHCSNVAVSERYGHLLFQGNKIIFFFSFFQAALKSFINSLPIQCVGTTWPKSNAQLDANRRKLIQISPKLCILSTWTVTGKHIELLLHENKAIWFFICFFFQN